MFLEYLFIYVFKKFFKGNAFYIFFSNTYLENGMTKVDSDLYEKYRIRYIFTDQ